MYHLNSQYCFQKFTCLQNSFFLVFFNDAFQKKCLATANIFASNFLMSSIPHPGIHCENLFQGIHCENLFLGIHCENLDWWNFYENPSVLIIIFLWNLFWPEIIASGESWNFHFLVLFSEIKEAVEMLIISNSTFVSRLFCWLRAFPSREELFKDEQPKRKTKFYMTMEV